MSINEPIYKPYKNPRLKKFFRDHKKAINLIFNTLKTYKPNIYVILFIIQIRILHNILNINIPCPFYHCLAMVLQINFI